MQPTDHIDSQLAALRSMVAATSSMPIPLPPPHSTPNAPPTFSGAAPSTPTGAGSGLTYDAFWSSHSSTSSYRSLLGGQNGPGVAGVRRPSVPLQAHASAPAALTPGIPAWLEIIIMLRTINWLQFTLTRFLPMYSQLG
ncbi:hypothetical protein PYCCODRAFT_715656 [Trametes coccinea BRFM310]|uniref:Uncharacterized protein n=1 Tax=Trametes coccinea (strain BRFM310) TaxID=1353009 RepID=A0A1Y2IFY6_TRAC3|nr:hypothetical protein PYCCODRAFT_715656 [Trametes coccinea BRFM310]